MSEAVSKRLNAAELAERFGASPFIKGLGLEIVKLDYDQSELTLKMPLLPAFERRPGTKQFHGGAIASLIDVCGDFALGMMIGGGIPTINLRIDYLKPAVGDGLTAVARVRRTGKTVAVIDIDVKDEKDSLVALGRGTYYPQVG